MHCFVFTLTLVYFSIFLLIRVENLISVIVNFVKNVEQT